MAHNSKRNRRHTTVQDGDDYVYPTKKVRNQTRSRRRDRNLIKASLIDINSPEVEETVSLDEEMIDDYNEMITDYNATEAEMDEADEADAYDRLHDDLMDDYGYDWEDY